MLNFKKEFFDNIKELKEFDGNIDFLPTNSFQKYKVGIYPTRYLINTSIFDSLFSHFFNFDWCDFKSKIIFIFKLCNIKLNDVFYYLYFQESISENKTALIFKIFNIDEDLYIKDINDTELVHKEFEKFKNYIEDIFNLLLKRYGIDNEIITINNIDLISQMSIGDYIRKNNKIKNLNYLSKEELILNFDIKNLLHKENNQIKFDEKKLTILYQVIDYILKSDLSYIKSIISLYKMYCYIKNKNFNIEFRVNSIFKAQRIGDLYSIYFEDFLTIKIAPNFFDSETNFLYHYNTVGSITRKTKTNNIKEIYNDALINKFSKDCKIILNKEIEDIKYKDFEIIKIISL